MLLLIVALAGIVVFYFFGEPITGAITLVFAVLTLAFMGSYENKYEDVASEQIAIAERYLISEHTDEDWQKTKELLQATNEKARKIATKENKYLLIDFISCISKSISADNYSVSISDDKIEFPEAYEILALNRIPLENNSDCDKVADASEPAPETTTYAETEINGTKFQLVPMGA